MPNGVLLGRNQTLKGEIQKQIIDLTGEPQEKTVVPSVETVVVEPDVAKRLTKVTVLGVTSEIDENISPMNIRKGKTILGVEGNLEPDKPDQSKVVSPSVEEQVVRADTGYELASVTVEGVTSDIDENIQADNIRYGVEILGVVGSMEQKEDLDAELTEQDTLLDELDGKIDELPDKDIDLIQTTATVEDVLQGKKFYNAQGEFVEGMYIPETSKLLEYISCLISGRGQTEIFIPENVTQIKPYAFDVYVNGCDQNVFTHHDFTIPPQIKKIYEYAFVGCNLTGTLTIPPTVEYMRSKPFQYTNISKCIIDTKLTSSATDLFSMCDNLRIIELTENSTELYRKNLGSLRYVTQIILPANMASIADGAFYASSAPESVKFLGTTPVPISTSVFSDIHISVIVVPLEAYYTYYNTTNYLASGNVMVGFKEFKAGDTLPTTIADIPVVWYTSPYNARFNITPITTCTEDGELYAKFSQ